MNTTQIKRMIGQCQDVKELAEVLRAARERISFINEKLYEQKCAEAWDRVKNLTPGTLLYCCAAGTFLGGPMQRGDSGKVYAIQPRKKLLWLELSNGKTVWFRHGAVHSYDLRTEPPAAPISAVDRAFANTAAKVVSETLNDKEKS